MSEESFLHRINNKERAAYHELFRIYYRSLVLYAMRYLERQEEAEDVVQDLFVAVWEKKEHFLSEQSMRVFLYNAVRNDCLNRLKHRKVQDKYVDYVKKQSDEHVGDYDELEEELYRWMFEVIDRLPARCREVFLCHLDGKTNEEIASELHITVLTVKTQKKKALKFLREQMGNATVYFLYIFHDCAVLN